MYHSIKGLQRTVSSVDVEISTRDIVHALVVAIKKKHGLDSDAYLQNGRVVCDERNHRHGSIGTDVLIENPTMEQVNALEFITSLYHQTKDL